MIYGFTPDALAQLGSVLGGGGATVVVDLGPVLRALQRIGDDLAKVRHAVENPRWAAGDEMYRRALLALHNGWYEEAARDAATSIDEYDLRSGPHLALGVAQLHIEESGTSIRAYESFVRAIRYGRVGEHPEAAAAGLLAAFLSDATDSPDASIEAIESADRAVEGRCPDLKLALLRRRPGDEAVARDLERLLLEDVGSTISLLDAPELAAFRAGLANGFDALTTTWDDMWLRLRQLLAGLAAVTDEGKIVGAQVVGALGLGYWSGTSEEGTAARPRDLYEALRFWEGQSAGAWRGPEAFVATVDRPTGPDNHNDDCGSFVLRARATVERIETVRSTVESLPGFVNYVDEQPLESVDFMHNARSRQERKIFRRHTEAFAAALPGFRRRVDELRPHVAALTELLPVALHAVDDWRSLDPYPPQDVVRPVTDLPLSLG